MTVFDKAVAEVRAGQIYMRRAAIQNNNSSGNNVNNNNLTTTTTATTTGDRDITYFNRTLVILLHLICLLTKLVSHLDGVQICRVKKAVFDFLRLEPQGRNGSTLLHLACARESSIVGRYPICQFPSLDAIRLLLECGADVEARDEDGNTCLHVAANNRPAKPLVKKTLLISTLLFRNYWFETQL